jgi:hypothetical protein
VSAGSAVAAAAAGTALGPRPLAAAARQLSAEVAKCALVWGMGGVNGSESVSLVAGLQTRMRAFTAECGAASAGAGRTLQVSGGLCRCRAPRSPYHRARCWAVRSMIASCETVNDLCHCRRRHGLVT